MSTRQNGPVLGPLTSYPDFSYDHTKGHQDDELAVIQEYYGPSKYFNLSAASGKPVDTTTLAQEYSRNNEYMTNIIQFNFVNGSGWFFAFAPPGRTRSMSKSWSIFTWERHAMEPAPEDTTPRYVTHSRETQEDQLTRFNIGASMRHDFFKRPEGKTIMDNNYASMISGGWITAKLVVGQQVINGKLYWNEWQAQYGVTHSGVMDAIRDEIDLFGALSKDIKGIYKLHHHVMEITRENAPAFNMIVLAKGALNFLVWDNSNFETEKYRRGEGIVESRLSLGARSMDGLFPGITIYEDEVFTLQNLGPDEINVFIRTAMIGRYMLVDGSDFGAHCDNYNSNQHLTIKAASMDIDAYKKISINTLIDKCMRWGGGADGDELSGYVQEMVKLAEQLLQTNGIRLHDEDLLDPYVWRDDTFHDPSDTNPSKSGPNGYHVIQHWGDMDKHYFTIKQNIIFGQKVAAMVRKEMKEKELEEIRELKSLKNRLYMVDDLLNESIEGYFTAVAANPENRPQRQRGQNEPPKEIMLKANRHGCVQPPYVDTNPTAELVRLFGAENDRQANLMQTGALYVIDPLTRKKEYVWAIYPEALRELTQEEVNSLTLSSLEPKNFLAIDVDISDPLLTEDARRNATLGQSILVNKETPQVGPGGYPAFYILAPINAFGQLNENGDAVRWWEGSAPLQRYRAASAVALENKQTLINDTKLVSNVGIKTIKLVGAPSIPVGYGIITGLRTIAQLHAERNYRGWDQEICTTAWKGIRSIDKLAKIMIRISGKCELLNEKYTAAYMLSPDKEENQLNNILSNLWDTVKYPVWVRQPGLITPFGGEQKYMGVQTNSNNQNIANFPAVPGIDHNDPKIIDILTAMGFTAGGHPIKLSGKYMDTTLLKNSLARILNDPNVDAKIFNQLTSEEGNRDRLFRSYSEKSGLGQAYWEHLIESVDDADLPDFTADKAKARSFAVLYNYAILPENESARVNIFNAILGLAFAAINGASHPHNANSIARILDKARAFDKTKKKVYKSGVAEDIKSMKKRQKDAVTTGLLQGAPGGGSLYVNTRLAIHGKVFHIMAEMAETSLPMLYRVANHILRPTDPSNTHRPLAGVVGSTASGINSDSAVRESLSDMMHARVGAPNRIGETIFANAHLVTERPLLQDDLYRGETEYDLEALKQYRIDPYKAGHQHMPNTLVNDPLGPLYVSAASSVDREGRPISETEKIKEKKWLTFRFEKLSAKLESDDIARMAALMLCLTKVCKSSLTNWVREGLPIPDCCYIIAQPWIRIRMSSGLWAEGGSKTAETGYNYEDVVMQFNGKNKTWHMHYTIWLGCFIYQPWKYIIMKDIKFEGYVSGMDDTFNDDPNAFDPQAIDWTTVKSSFVFSCGATFSRDLALKTANPLSLYGKYDPKALPQNFADRNRIFSPNGPLFPSYPYYDFIWGFHSINAVNDIDYSTFAAIRESTFIPGLMPIANYLTYSEVDKDWTKLEKGTGHLDSLPVPMLSILNGKISFPYNKDR